MNMGIGPVHERHNAFEGHRLGIVELCQNLVMRHRRRGRQQKSSKSQGDADSAEFIAILLLSADFERAIFGSGFPRADDAAIAFWKIFDLAVDDVRDRFPGLVLGVALEVHDPAFGIERRVLDLDLVGTGINRSGNGLAVPVHHDDHVVAVVLARAPRADPGPLDGCPSCAAAGAVDARQMRARLRMQVNARTCVPFLGLAIRNVGTSALPPLSLRARKFASAISYGIAARKLRNNSTGTLNRFLAPPANQQI